MLKVENLEKYFGAQAIFDNTGFVVNEGEKIGLVGRNGHGKTTLLKLIIGEEHPNSGIISIPKEYRIGYVKQHLKFTKKTLLEEASLGLQDHEKDETWKVEKTLSGLGFTQKDFNRDPCEFSGGFQVRLNLCKVLVSEPEMLLLDEPTNYLDVISIRWLKAFLKRWKRELILITHDRSFMNDIITHTLGIHRTRIRKVKGNTDALYEQILKEEEIHEKTRLNDERKQKDMEVFISRFRAKARLAGMVQSRIKALDKKEKLGKLEKIKNLEFSFSEAPFNAKMILQAESLSFSYTKDNPLIEDLSMNISKHDRICVIGKNGKGKTTLLKLLAGSLKPNTGKCSYHSAASLGYFEQTNIQTLNSNSTVEQEIMNMGCERQCARNIAGAMLFEGDNALKKIEVLSGGEKSRVLLGKILASPLNILLLDEPTNHLDMESCDALIAAIDAFEGAVVMVTHNELFLHTLANRFIIFQSGTVQVYEGSYQSFLDNVGWEEEIQEGKESTDSGNAFQQINKKEHRKIRADIQQRKSRDLKPIEKDMKKLENKISEKEKEAEKANNALLEASQSGRGDEIAELSRLHHELSKEIETLYDDLEAVTVKHEELEKVFNQELAALSDI